MSLPLWSVLLGFLVPVHRIIQNVRETKLSWLLQFISCPQFFPSYCRASQLLQVIGHYCKTFTVSSNEAKWPWQFCSLKICMANAWCTWSVPIDNRIFLLGFLACSVNLYNTSFPYSNSIFCSCIDFLTSSQIKPVKESSSVIFTKNSILYWHLFVLKMV